MTKAYAFRVAGTRHAPDRWILADLAMSADDPARVTAVATGSLPRPGLLEVWPTGVRDPAGNPATGSARLE